MLERLREAISHFPRLKSITLEISSWLVDSTREYHECFLKLGVQFITHMTQIVDPEDRLD